MKKLKEIKGLVLTFLVTVMFLVNWLGVHAHICGITTGHISSDIATNALQTNIPWWTFWLIAIVSSLWIFLFLAAWDFCERIIRWIAPMFQAGTPILCI